MTLGHLHDINREVIFPSHMFYRRETKTKTGSAQLWLSPHQLGRGDFALRDLQTLL